ncbi:hypothetical protein [Shimia sp.]|uniref:hypothetical protein n=1 Tax=Shimia sp. TaxID=1954381 RepID=UPI003BAA0121
MIELQPYSDHMAMHVFSSLDPNDHIEAELVRGVSTSHLAIFADWRSLEGARLLSLVITDDSKLRTPFAVLGLSNTGQAGVAQAALLSRSHARFKPHLRYVAKKIRRELPTFAEQQGVHRIEARSWSDHPTANRFLRCCGFRLETQMPGFGASGAFTFNQFAWISPNLKGETKCV